MARQVNLPGLKLSLHAYLKWEELEEADVVAAGVAALAIAGVTASVTPPATAIGVMIASKRRSGRLPP